MWTRAIVFLILVFLSGSILVKADYQVGNGFIFSRSGYDYAPAVIQEGNLQRFWWCGLGNAPGFPNQTDVIFYRTFDFNTNQWSAISTVLVPTPGAWDSRFVCDPSVVGGNFVNPENGQSYSLVMYYTATNLDSGTNNRIGLAYSNDGINWVKYSNPVIYPQVLPTSTYGAGQSSIWNYNSSSGVWIFYTDASTTFGDRIWARSATDGVNFGAPVLISNQGLAVNLNSDFAYDYSTDYFYAVVSLPGRSGDRAEYAMAFAKIPREQLLNGTGTWDTVGYIDTNLTGHYLNHNPGLLHDIYGNLTPWLPNIQAYFAAGENNPDTWDLTFVILRPSPITLPFKRYYNATNARYLVTTGYLYPGYVQQSTLGHLFMFQRKETHPLYACQAYDFFVSPASNCEGQKVLGINGWIYTTRRLEPTAQPIYRCRGMVTGSHFVSSDPNCEGEIVELNGEPLGYIQQTP